jgi:hypothetical protein
MKVAPTKSAYCNSTNREVPFHAQGEKIPFYGSRKSYKYLGIMINIEENWNDEIRYLEGKLKPILDTLSSRKVTLDQRITIYNVLVATIISYPMQIMKFPDAFLGRLERMILSAFQRSESLWVRGRCDLLWQPQNRGGLGMISIKQLQASVHLGTIHRILNSSTLASKVLNVFMDEVLQASPDTTLWGHSQWNAEQHSWLSSANWAAHQCQVSAGRKRWTPVTLKTILEGHPIVNCLAQCGIHTPTDLADNSRQLVTFKALSQRTKRQLSSDMYHIIVQTLQTLHILNGDIVDLDRCRQHRDQEDWNKKQGKSFEIWLPPQGDFLHHPIAQLKTRWIEVQQRTFPNRAVKSKTLLPWKVHHQIDWTVSTLISQLHGLQWQQLKSFIFRLRTHSLTTRANFHTHYATARWTELCHTLQTNFDCHLCPACSIERDSLEHRILHCTKPWILQWRSQTAQSLESMVQHKVEHPTQVTFRCWWFDNCERARARANIILHDNVPHDIIQWPKLLSITGWWPQHLLNYLMQCGMGTMSDAQEMALKLHQTWFESLLDFWNKFDKLEMTSLKRGICSWTPGTCECQQHHTCTDIPQLHHSLVPANMSVPHLLSKIHHRSIPPLTSQDGQCPPQIDRRTTYPLLVDTTPGIPSRKRSRPEQVVTQAIIKGSAPVGRCKLGAPHNSPQPRKRPPDTPSLEKDLSEADAQPKACDLGTPQDKKARYLDLQTSHKRITAYSPSLQKRKVTRVSVEIGEVFSSPSQGKGDDVGQ